MLLQNVGGQCFRKILKLFCSDLEKTGRDATLNPKNNQLMNKKFLPGAVLNHESNSSMKNQKITFTLTIIALTCFGVLAPKAFGVSPAPDGCYSNFTTAEGCGALNSLTTGPGNTGLGWRSLFLNSTGGFNTGIGVAALALNNGDSNTAVGAAALLLNTTGGFNTATGASALQNNTEGFSNTATGASALQSNTSGIFNTAIGVSTLQNNINGQDNTAVGRSALTANQSGSRNTALGASAGSDVTTAQDVICIGAGITGADVSNRCYIGSIRGVTTGVGDAVPVVIDSAFQLGTQSSSRKFKTDIKPMDKASEAILALKPVSFRYKSHPAGAGPQFGLIAEEVEKVDPDLIVRDKNGEIYTVRYDAVNAMLLNEFLKEHRKVQELEATLIQQRKDFRTAMTKLEETVTAQLKEQAAQIQKVSAKLTSASPSSGGLEANNAVFQTAFNDR
jgi:hypothetical protein